MAANDLITKLYVGYFNRAPDVAGMNFWTAQYNALGQTPGTLVGIAQSFAVDTEAKNLYGFLAAPLVASPASFLASVYTNLFGRAIDAAGATYWAGQLALPGAAVGRIIIDIISGAQGDDLLVVNNKTAVASAFTNKAADLNAGVSLSILQGALTGVTKDVATRDAKILSNDGVIATFAGTVGGSTFTLTAGADSFVGGTGGDVFNGVIDTVTIANTTLGVTDNINGSIGNDTLNVTVVGAAAVPGLGVISGIENLSVRNTAAAGATVATVTATGYEQIAATGTGDVTINLLGAGKAFTANGAGTTGAGANIVQQYVTGATSAITNLIGSVLGTVTLSNAVGTTLASAVINTSGTASTTGAIALGTAATALTINAAANLTTTGITGFTGTAATITVNGLAANVNLGAIETATVKTINAAGLTAGGVTAVLAAAPPAGFTFTGGAGQDIITTGSVLATGQLVDAGAGTTDRLIVAASAHIDATAGKLYKGFEQLQVNDGVTVAAPLLASTNTIDAIRINDAGGATGVTGLTAAQAAAVSIIAAGAAGAISIGITGATTGGQIDTVKAALTTTTAAGAAQAIDITGIVLDGIEKLELTGNGTAAATTGAVTLTTTAATSLDSIIFSNAAAGNSITIAAGQTGTNLIVDASASAGGVTINATAYNTTTGSTLKGGSSHDALLGSIRIDTLTGGAGNDTLSGDSAVVATLGTAAALGTFTSVAAASATTDILTGGAGRDAFGFGVVALANADSVTDLDLGGATALLGVDSLTFDVATPGTAATIVTLTAAQQTTVTAAATLAAAVDAVLLVGAALNNVTQFTYGTDTYVVINGVAATAAYTAAEDVLVKITGVVGTLDASDIALV